MKNDEYKIQKSVIIWLEYQFPNALFCGSMGGQYQKYHSQRLKAKKTGYRKGFPDLFIYEPNNYHGIAIEIKTKTGRATKEQLKWIDDLNKRGYYAVVCKGFDECVSTIKKYMNGKLNK